MIKTRFAPSPTGYIHLGNARTALFSYLVAQRDQGIFLLRIEDTDQLRSGAEFAIQLEYDLEWLGTNWQEGPNRDGVHGPYFQSQRQAIYAKYFHRLEEEGFAYPCFCTEQELAINRKIQLSAGQPPRYPGTCRHLTLEQVAKKLEQGLRPTLRFRVPEGEAIEFHDLVRGFQRFLTNDIGDFVIRRADGTAAFFFCNAIDDALMGVTQVLRGEDHLTNTPRQLMILQSLDLPQPAYGHMAMILGPDGSPLSKRHGSRSIKVLHKQGYLPLAILNYLGRLGHYYSQNEFMSLEELAANFRTENIGKAPARFDDSQLLYWQKQAVQKLSFNEFWEWLNETTKVLVPEGLEKDFMEAVRNNVTFPEEAEQWAQVFFGVPIEFLDQDFELLRQAGLVYFETAIFAAEKVGADAKAILDSLQQNLNLKGKALFQPLRLALTGRMDGPELARITQLLGEDVVRERLRRVLERI